jgi:tetratricopeptide (TPR) repeat protein
MEALMQRALTRHAWLTAFGMIAILLGCNRSKSDSGRETGAVGTEDAGKDPAGTGTAARGKIPVSTESEEARRLYAQGLERFDQVRSHDARQLFDQAVAKDPDFAMAHYQLAINAPSPKEFRAHLDRAVALSAKATEGERLLILSLEAGANADPEKGTEYLKQAVEKYPQDERAHLFLGFNYAGRQEYENAIDEYKKAIEVNPGFAPAYNLLGYAYSPLRNYAEAEKAFKKYIELVPNDPNPYDSYAELLLKTGRFDESIAQYRKALSIDPHFVGSYFGIAGDLMYQGKHDQAIAEAEKLDRAARDDGERRFALLTKAIVYVDQGKSELALQEMQKRYDMAARSNDAAAMAADAVAIGNILLNAGKPDEAMKRYEQALGLRQKSALPEEVKEDAKLAHHYSAGRVALKKNDLATAKAEAATYLNGATAKKNEARVREAHGLVGMIALKEKRFDQAIAELNQADQENPYVLYKSGVAYQGKGDQSKAAEMFKRAAESYTTPSLDYAFIRAKAKQPAAPRSTS